MIRHLMVASHLGKGGGGWTVESLTQGSWSTSKEGGNFFKITEGDCFKSSMGLTITIL